MEILLIAFAPGINNDDKSATDKEKNSSGSKHALKTSIVAGHAHSIYSRRPCTLDFSSRDLPSNQPIPNKVHHRDRWRACRYSLVSQGPPSEISQDRRNTESLRVDTLATLSPTERVLEPEEKLQVPQEPCNRTARHHRFDASEMIRL